MILVLLGTNPYDFRRLLEAIDSYAESSEERVEVQLGYSTTIPVHAVYFRFLPNSEIEQKIRDARIVITQGGYGSIYECLKLEKRVIAVPRLKEEGEAQDSGLGQSELVRHLETQGKILALYDVADLPAKLKEAESFEPNLTIHNEVSPAISRICAPETRSGRKSGYNVFRNIDGLIFKNRLLEMTFFVTDRCNFKCKHCFLLDKLNTKKTKFLSVEEVQAMGKHIHSMQRVHIGGGEPLMRNDIADLVVSVAEDWNTQTICLPTNGSVEKNAVKVAQQFGTKSKKYLRFHFSLNALGEEMNDFSVHPKAFQLWEGTVKKVQENVQKFRNISLTVITTFNDFNQAKIDDLMSYIKNKVRPDDISFALVRGHKTYHPELDVKKFEEVNHQLHYESESHSPFIRAYRELIRKKIARYYRDPKFYVPCQSGKLRVVMSPEGDVFPCENLGYPEGPDQDRWKMGNIREFDYNIQNLLTSSPARAIQATIKNTRCHCHHGVDMSVSYQSTLKFKVEVALLGTKYWFQRLGTDGGRRGRSPVIKHL
jgi:radical SAM protein with 4Fe4S-binding SPASM domain